MIAEMCHIKVEAINAVNANGQNLIVKRRSHVV